MFIGAHGAFAQPQHFAVLVMQGHGMGTRRLDGRAHFLAHGIEIDERTIRRAEGFAVLHRSAVQGFRSYIYRMSAFLNVMLFAKTRQWGSRLTYHRNARALAATLAPCPHLLNPVNTATTIL